MSSQTQSPDNEGFFTKSFWRDALIMLLSVVLTYVFTNKTVEDGYVKALSVHFDYIDETMSLEDAIDKLVTKNEEQKREISAKDSEIKKLQNDLANKSNELKNQQNEMDGLPTVSIESPSLVIEGLKQDSAPGKSLAIIDGTSYYSESLTNSLLDGSVSYSEDEKTVYYTTEKSGKSPSKVELSDTKALHDGYMYEIYSGDSSNLIQIGSNTYSYGFTLGDPRFIHSNNAFALFDFGGKYSTLSFDVGRISDTEVNDATLKIYVDGDKEASQQYELSGDIGSQHLDVPLDYAQSLKIELIADHDTKYGFVNAILSE